MKEAYHTAGCAVEILRPAFGEQGGMAETEVVSRFKEFARVRLLAAFREAGSAALSKQPIYGEIRDSFTADHGWPKELDEIEPGPARTPRWLNRLHWVVAELVQTGVLEPSEGRDTLHPTPFGHDLLQLPAPFRDTPQTRALIEAVQSTEPDERRTAEAEQALADFRRRFPPEKLGTLTLDEYAIGGGDRDNFCWWLERGLQNLGRYTPGSSWGHFLYKAKGGSIERIQKLKELSAEEAMQRVADWHAAVVRIGGGEKPELLDTSPPDFPESRSRILKVLNSYLPDRFLPINSVAHLGRFLSEFGVQESDIPQGPIARNHLLLKLYQAVGQPHGLSPWDFMRLLYTQFDPKPVRLDQTRLNGAIRLFTWMYGGCKSAAFVEDERAYQEEIAQRWQAVSSLEELARAVTGGREVEKARDLSRALLDPPSNLINYRYHPPIRDLSDPSDARLFVEAVAELLRSGEAEDAVPDVGRFNARMAPLYERLGPEQRNAASRSIPTLILMLTFPERDIYVRSDVFHRARQVLAKKPAFEDEGMLSTPAYRELRSFAEAVRDGIDTLEPADMIDVQGFLWAVFSHSDLWFGGVTFTDESGAHDMLDRFRERGVYAVGWGENPALRELVAGAGSLKTEERKARADQIGAAAASRAEAAALQAFVELAARPGSILVVKSTYWREQSILRVRGVAIIDGNQGFDPDLGHTARALWREQRDVRLRLGKAFSKLAGTLVPLKMVEALDVLGAEEVAGPDEDVEVEHRSVVSEGAETVVVSSPPVLPKNLILYGPPGTGKTWEVLEKIRPHFGPRVEMITFHPNFAYEEFVEGLRPITDETVGHVRYEVVPGVFRRVCNEALAHAELPHLLIIDEINRANLAAVFGELITLIEEDKRDKGYVTLPYSKERFTVPGNLWIVGTMNTADRSIALMDVALRRRFVFREVGVDYTVLTNDFAEATDPLLVDLDLAAILQALNQRLRLLVDREHQIGHAWLMGVRSLDDLRERFANRILPLLAEYFFDDWSRICLVLGEDPLTSRETDLVRKTILPVDGQQRLFGRIVRDGGPVVLYDPGGPAGWTVEHFAKIVPSPEMEPEAEK